MAKSKHVCGKSEILTARCSESVRRMIKQLSRAEGISMSEVLAKCITEYFMRHKPPAAPRKENRVSEPEDAVPYGKARSGKSYRFSAVITRENQHYVSSCPELDVTSQGLTVEEARDNLREAVELYLESADPSEIRLPIEPPLVSAFDVALA